MTGDNGWPLSAWSPPSSRKFVYELVSLHLSPRRNLSPWSESSSYKAILLFETSKTFSEAKIHVLNPLQNAHPWPGVAMDHQWLCGYRDARLSCYCQSRPVLGLSDTGLCLPKEHGQGWMICRRHQNLQGLGRNLERVVNEVKAIYGMSRGRETNHRKWVAIPDVRPWGKATHSSWYSKDHTPDK